MANRKYDYSDELSPSADSASETAKTSEMEEASLVSSEEMRRQRLERRNDALANEFRRLKPEIADTHKQLINLIEVIGAYAGTIQNLYDSSNILDYYNSAVGLIGISNQRISIKQNDYP